MLSRVACCGLAIFLGSALAAGAMAPRQKNPLDDARLWVVEQMPGGAVEFGGGRLSIRDKAGCTVWWKEPLTVPVTISYEVTVVNQGGAFDRVSDLNCFWMATDPRSPGDLFAPGHARIGKFEAYDGLRTYYVGQGGNENTTTRFRRYAGDGTKPLLPEHHRREPALLLEGNRAYRIKIEALANGVVRYWRDDVLVFDFKDPAPLTRGWFGFRTVMSHLQIRDFKITQ